MTEREKVDTSGYEFRPADKALASALDTAERLAKEADQKFCAAFGGDGETVAYWLTAAIAEIRATLALAALRAPATVTEAMVIDAKMAMEGWAGESYRYACRDLFRRGDSGMMRLHAALTAALGGAR